MKKRLVVWGWWQGRNLGDNWIKRTIAGLFPEAEFIDTRIQDFSAYDFVICGGGGLFIYDVIRPWSGYAQKTPYGMLGLGAEFPHKSDEAQKLSRNAAFFYVRDRYSLQCMKLNDLECSYDITFAAPLRFEDGDELDLNKVFFVWRDGHDLLWNEQFKEYIGHKGDLEEYNRILSQAFGEIMADDFQTSGNDIEDRLTGCGFVISGRYHGIVAAIQKGLPCIAVDICPKIRSIMRDCGLEEYCIKIGETDKLGALIQKGKAECAAIRKKQLAYREKAGAMLGHQLADVHAAIDKVLNPLRVIQYGSYWMGDNDVVKVMADDLGQICDTREVDLKVYTRAPDGRIKVKINTPNGLICILDTDKIKKDIEDFRPDAVVLNSGGLTLEDEGFKLLNELGVNTVGISLSDPDVYPYNGAFYADKFDLFYTNSKHSLEYQYDNKKVNIRCLPFAASTRHHFYMPDEERKYDLIVVGHARGDRIPVIEALSKRFKVGVYGAGWPSGLGEVHGLAHVKALNSGLMYLSFAKTAAGFQNVKVGLFEAMACNQVVITRYMDELGDYFEIGKEIICYEDDSALPDIVAYYLGHEAEREAIRKNAYTRFLNEHTYLNRWRSVKDDIKAVKEKMHKTTQIKHTAKQLTDIQWSKLYDRSLVDRIYHNIQNGNLSAQSTEMLRISREGDKILEIGCGSGSTSAYLATNGRTVTALDFQDESLLLTKALCDKLGCSIEVVKADAREALPFQAQAFDIAFQAGLLEHFEREARIEMLRLWKPYCRKMISLIPNAASLGYRMGKGLMEKNGTWPYGTELPQYSLIRDFEAAGYRVTGEYTIGEKNSLNFLPKTHYLRQALETWLSEMDLCGDNCGQGYLLVTIGES